MISDIHKMENLFWKRYARNLVETTRSEKIHPKPMFQ